MLNFKITYMLKNFRDKDVNKLDQFQNDKMNVRVNQNKMSEKITI